MLLDPEVLSKRYDAATEDPRLVKLTVDEMLQFMEVSEPEYIFRRNNALVSTLPVNQEFVLEWQSRLAIGVSEGG